MISSFYERGRNLCKHDMVSDVSLNPILETILHDRSISVTTPWLAFHVQNVVICRNDVSKICGKYNPVLSLGFFCQSIPSRIGDTEEGSSSRGCSSKTFIGSLLAFGVREQCSKLLWLTKVHGWCSFLFGNCYNSNEVFDAAFDLSFTFG